MPALICKPLVLETWKDLEALFGSHGSCGGCWCMWWRLTRAEFARQGREGNRQALKALVAAGEIPGLLAYLPETDDPAVLQPVGWVSVGPRQAFPVLGRSRSLKRVDDQPVWSVVCFFVARPYRKQGIAAGLLAAAVDFARQRGAHIIEGYPKEPGLERAADASIFTGPASVFLQAGFVEVARRSEKRPVMRFTIE